MEGQKVRDAANEMEYHELGPSMVRLIRTDLKGYLYMKDSDNPNLRRRAAHLASKMPNYRALLYAVARLVPTPEMRAKTEDVLAGIEDAFGPTTSFEKVMAAGLWTFGTKQKIRYNLFGDVIQPPTRLMRYPAMN